MIRAGRRGAAWRRAGALVCLLLPLAGCAAAAPPARIGPRPAQKPNYVPGEYILTTRGAQNIDALKRVYRAFGVEAIRALGPGQFLLRLSNDPGPEEMRRRGLDSGKVKSVQRNFIYR